MTNTGYGRRKDQRCTGAGENANGEHEVPIPGTNAHQQDSADHENAPAENEQSWPFRVKQWADLKSAEECDEY